MYDHEYLTAHIRSLKSSSSWDLAAERHLCAPTADAVASKIPAAALSLFHPATSRKEAAPKSRRIVSESTNSFRALPSSLTFTDDTTKPFWPCTTMSAAQPTLSETTIGNPKFIASFTTLPQVS